MPHEQSCWCCQNNFGPANVDKIGLGLDSQYRPTLTDPELEVRFDLIEQLGIREIDIWVDKVPESWLPYLRKFLGKTTSDAVVGGYGGLGQSRLRPKDEAAAEAQWQPH